jgi:hypothetical protein
MTESFWPGVTFTYSTQFAGKNDALLAVAATTPALSEIKYKHALLELKRIEYVFGPKALVIVVAVL